MIIDTHIHLDMYTEEEINQILKDENYKIYAVSTGVESSLKLLELKEKYKNLEIAIGIHPEYFDNYNQVEKIRKLIFDNKEKIFGIGEVGLPYFYLENLLPKEREDIKARGEKIFIEFIKMAKTLKLPLIIHATGTSTQQALELIKEHKIEKAVFHWLFTDYETHMEVIDAGYFYSVSIDYLYNESYRKYINSLPVKNVIFESDGPWSYVKEKSHPIEINELINMFSAEKGMSKKDVIELLEKNTKIIYETFDK